jgi:hypothetical protein
MTTRYLIAGADGVIILFLKADVETKLACALASRALRQPVMTSRCWPQEVHVDLHDSRQLRWLSKAYWGEILPHQNLLPFKWFVHAMLFSSSRQYPTGMLPFCLMWFADQHLDGGQLCSLSLKAYPGVLSGA